MSGAIPLVSLNIPIASVWRLKIEDCDCVSKQICLCLEVHKMLTVYRYILCEGVVYEMC